MAEADTASITSSADSIDNIQLENILLISQYTEVIQEADKDSELQAVAGRLDQTLNLEPSVDISISLNKDTDSADAASLSSSKCEEHEQPDSQSDHSDDAAEFREVTDDLDNGQEDPTDNAGEDKTDSKKDKRKKRKNPLRLLKKLTKFDKSKKRDKLSEFEQVHIDKLPQVFVAKYLGKREAHGFCGLHHVRKPVDEMVSSVQQSLEKQKQVELPLVYVVISPKGLDIRQHKLNKQKEGVPTGLVPIDFISYGVQDIKYWRVFSFIVVKELSSRSKRTECHAYLCDSSLNARKMALSLGASFKIYSRSLKKEGKIHNFQVELRPPDELVEALTSKDCDV